MYRQARSLAGSLGFDVKRAIPLQLTHQLEQSPLPATRNEFFERASGGTVEVQLYPNRQLGDERQMLDGMRFGTVDAGIVTDAVIAQIEPAFQVNDLPFLYANEAQAHRILDGKVGDDDLAKRLESKGIVVLGYMEGGFRHMINNKRQVDAPADVEGVKYRVIQNPMYIDMFNSMGGVAVPMPWGETFTAVQQAPSTAWRFRWR